MIRALTRKEIEALGTYNAEVARGIVHTKSYDQHMADLQESFDLMQKMQSGIVNSQ